MPWPWSKSPKEDAPAPVEVRRAPVVTRERGRAAWWFAPPGARPKSVDFFVGRPEPGRAGLHGAPGPLAALAFAKSGTLCRVQLDGDVVEVDGQLAATERRVLWVLEATEPLRQLARKWIVAVLAETAEPTELSDPGDHRERAGDARERAIDAEHRLRDAEWVLGEGAARASAEAKARAEGEVVGAKRATRELRAAALAHEAAAALLEGDEIRHVAQAIERVTHARAELRGGDDADAALAAVREELEAEAIAGLDAAPKEEPELASPRAVFESSTAHAESAELDPSETRHDAAPTMARRAFIAEAPSAPPRIGPIERLDAMALEAPFPSGAEVVERLRALEASDEVRSVHPVPLYSDCWDALTPRRTIVLVVRHEHDGADEQRRRLDRDVVCRDAGLDFLVTWGDDPTRSVHIGRYLCGRRLGFLREDSRSSRFRLARLLEPNVTVPRAELVHAVREAASIPLGDDADLALRVELSQVPEVRSAAWLSPCLALWLDRPMQRWPELLARIHRGFGGVPLIAVVGESVRSAIAEGPRATETAERWLAEVGHYHAVSALREGLAFGATYARAAGLADPVSAAPIPTVSRRIAGYGTARLDQFTAQRGRWSPGA